MRIGEYLAAAAVIIVTIGLVVGFGWLTYESRQEVEACKARGGVITRELGCVDLRKIRP